MVVVNIVGARPQFMKYFPIAKELREFEKSIIDILIHTGQHYDYKLSKIFFDELNIKKPNYHLDVGSRSHGVQTAQIIERSEPILSKYKPDIVIVYGDTNTTLGGAIAASKMNIPVVHIEAGLRSYNKRMPEESNRILTDHISTYLFCPSKQAVMNLKSEGFKIIFNEGEIIEEYEAENPIVADINHPVVINSGDVMHDTIRYLKTPAQNKSNILLDLKLHPKEYYVLTLHRVENIDNRNRFRELVGFINGVTDYRPIIFPMHPRTRKVFDEFDITFNSNVKIIEPLGYIDLIHLLNNAYMLLTDSGGMQKEAYWLNVPCITLRDETEWVETIETGWNILYKNYSDSFIPSTKKISIYGDGKAAKYIVRYLVNSIR